MNMWTHPIMTQTNRHIYIIHSNGIGTQQLGCIFHIVYSNILYILYQIYCIILYIFRSGRRDSTCRLVDVPLHLIFGLEINGAQEMRPKKLLAIYLSRSNREMLSRAPVARILVPDRHDDHQHRRGDHHPRGLPGALKGAQVYVSRSTTISTIYTPYVCHTCIIYPIYPIYIYHTYHIT